MILKIYNGEYSLQWDGIYHLALIDYPNIQEWELEKIAKFIAYEKLHKRQTSIECADSCLKKRFQITSFSIPFCHHLPLQIKE